MLSVRHSPRRPAAALWRVDRRSDRSHRARARYPRGQQTRHGRSVRVRPRATVAPAARTAARLRTTHSADNLLDSRRSADSDLANQPRLADARVADDVHVAAVPVDRVLRLGLALEQSGVRAFRNRRHVASARRRTANQDAARHSRAFEPLCRVDGVADNCVRTLHVAGQQTRDDLAGVDSEYCGLLRQGLKRVSRSSDKTDVSAAAPGRRLRSAAVCLRSRQPSWATPAVVVNGP